MSSLCWDYLELYLYCIWESHHQQLLHFYLAGSHIIRSMFKSSPPNKHNVQPLPPLDQESEHLSTLCLNCLLHFFSWMPLSGNITPNLITVIFHFANFGCDIQSVSRGTTSPANDSFSSSGSSSLGVLAMSCINEIMSKNCVPSDFEDYLLRMFQQTFQLLQKLTKDNTNQSVGNRLEDLDERWVKKQPFFTEGRTRKRVCI